MKIYEIGTGYTSIPAQIAAATETVVEELSKALLELGENVYIVDIEDSQRKSIDVPLLEVPFPRFLQKCDQGLGLFHKFKRVCYSLALTQKLHSLIRKETETVILHFHNQYNLFFFQLLTPRSLKKKVKSVYTNHNGHWSRPWKDAEQLLRRRYFQEIYCMKKTDKVFVLNPKMEQNILQNLKLPSECVRTIDNGVNIERYHPLSEEERQKYRKQWNLDERLLILQVGSVNENKGQIRTLEYLLPQLKNNKQLLFGYAGGIVDKAYDQALLDLAEQEGVEDQLRYFGMLTPGDELNHLFNCAEATIHSSEYEAFSLVLLESLAAGVPVILCGKSEEMLTSELNQICHLNHVEESCSAVRERYSWTAVAKKYASVFRAMNKES